MMPLNPILEEELFDIWGIDFMGPFLVHLDTSTSWWLWIMCLSGFRSFLTRQMTTKLLSSSWKRTFSLASEPLEL